MSCKKQPNVKIDNRDLQGRLIVGRSYKENIERGLGEVMNKSEEN